MVKKALSEAIGAVNKLIANNDRGRSARREAERAISLIRDEVVAMVDYEIRFSRIDLGETTVFWHNKPGLKGFYDRNEVLITTALYGDEFWQAVKAIVTWYELQAKKYRRHHG